MRTFHICGGSVHGSDHAKPGQPGYTNNHDAFRFLWKPECIIGVVCDGCGSGAHSEVGANIGASLVLQGIAHELPKYEQAGLDEFPWERIKQQMLGQLSVLASAMGTSLSKTVNDHFLFTALGVIMTPFTTNIFSIGDGVYVLNGKVTHLGPFPGNAPPYLAYNLTGSTLTDTHPELLKFSVRTIPTDEINTLILGTDGVADLIELEHSFLPGKCDSIGPIDQFTEPRFFSNPDAVRRRLNMINRDIIDTGSGREPVIKPGPLHDDTTLIAIRRKASGEP